MSEQPHTNADKTNVEPKNTPDSTPTPERTFTQAEVSKMMAREKSKGQSTVFSDLGIDPKDTATLEEIKKFVQNKKPEALKIAEQQLQQQEAIKQAQKRAFMAECKAELLQAGAQRDALDDVMALIAIKKQEDVDITTEIEALKTKFPFWFETSEDEKPKNGAGTGNPTKTGQGTGNPIPPGQSNKKEPPEDLGKRLAERQKTQQVKSTYW